MSSHKIDIKSEESLINVFILIVVLDVRDRSLYPQLVKYLNQTVCCGGKLR